MDGQPVLFKIAPHDSITFKHDRKLAFMEAIVVLQNLTSNKIVFKIKGSNLEDFDVTPSFGLLLPRQTMSIYFKCQRTDNINLLSGTKFAVYAMATHHQGFDYETLYNAFHDKVSNKIQRTKLLVYFIMDEQPPNKNGHTVDVGETLLETSKATIQKSLRVENLSKTADPNISMEIQGNTVANNSQNQYFKSKYDDTVKRLLEQELEILKVCEERNQLKKKIQSVKDSFSLEPAKVAKGLAKPLKLVSLAFISLVTIWLGCALGRH